MSFESGTTTRHVTYRRQKAQRAHGTDMVHYIMGTEHHASDIYHAANDVTVQRVPFSFCYSPMHSSQIARRCSRNASFSYGNVTHFA